MFIDRTMNDIEAVREEVYKVIKRHVGFHDVDLSLSPKVAVNYKATTIYFDVDIGIDERANVTIEILGEVQGRINDTSFRRVFGHRDFDMSHPELFNKIDEFLEETLP